MAQFIEQHNEHCSAWRWHMYIRDNTQRMANVAGDARLIAGQSRANMTSQQRADIELAYWQALRVRS